MTFIKNRIWIVSVVLLLLIGGIVLYLIRSTEEQVNVTEVWGSQGAVVVPWGPSMEPFDPRVDTTYELYSKAGEKLDAVTGKGAYSPGALMLDNVTALSFRESFSLIGEGYRSIDFNGESLDNSLVAPDGSFGAFFSNVSSGMEFDYGIQIVLSNGEVKSSGIDGVPQSNTVSEEGILSLVRQVGEDPNNSTYFLNFLDKAGDSHRLGFPTEFDPRSVIGVAGSMGYSGNGNYYLVESEPGVEEGDRIRYEQTMHHFRIEEQGGALKVVPTKVEQHALSRDLDPALVMMSRRDVIAWVSSDGAVESFNYATGETKSLGEIPAGRSLQQPDIGRVLGVTRNFFYTIFENHLEVRDWEDPSNVITEISLDSSPCESSFLGLQVDNGCGLTSPFIKL